MNERSVRRLLGVGAGISVFGLGVLGGAVIERTWYQPSRAAMLDQVEGTLRAYEARVTAGEPGGPLQAPRLNRPSRSSR
jgi:hypothetical protein